MIDIINDYKSNNNKFSKLDKEYYNISKQDAPSIINFIAEKGLKFTITNGNGHKHFDNIIKESNDFFEKFKKYWPEFSNEIDDAIKLYYNLLFNKKDSTAVLGKI